MLGGFFSLGGLAVLSCLPAALLSLFIISLFLLGMNELAVHRERK
jgi:hypothetical protein